MKHRKNMKIIAALALIIITQSIMANVIKLELVCHSTMSPCGDSLKAMIYSSTCSTYQIFLRDGDKKKFKIQTDAKKMEVSLFLNNKFIDSATINLGSLHFVTLRRGRAFYTLSWCQSLWLEYLKPAHLLKPHLKRTFPQVFPTNIPQRFFDLVNQH